MFFSGWGWPPEIEEVEPWVVTFFLFVGAFFAANTFLWILRQLAT